MSTDDVTTRIAYEHGDYACYATVEGVEEYIGSRGNYTDASTLCREWRYDYYADHFTPEKAAQVTMEQEPAATYARPAEPAADVLYACPCGVSDDGPADTTTYAPIGDCVLCHNPAWHLDESCAGLLCPDHRAQETEWIANRYVAMVGQPGGSGGGGGHILAYCVRCGRPGTTTDPDADYICPACLATTARMGRAASTAAS